MKTTRATVALAATTFLGLGLAATTATAATATGSTDSVTASGLALNREEERMAQDLYAALATTYDQARPMSMITRSETQHFKAIGALLTAHGVTDPSAGLAPGTYAFPELQALYDQWLAKGSESINAAYAVGVELEQRDIADLKKAMAATTEPDVQAVYQRLLAASERHLAAYQRAVAGDPLGGADGSMTGPGAGRGPGQGMGMGMNSSRGQKGQNDQNNQNGQGAGRRGAGPQGRSGGCPLPG